MKQTSIPKVVTAANTSSGVRDPKCVFNKRVVKHGQCRAFYKVKASFHIESQVELEDYNSRYIHFNRT